MLCHHDAMMVFTWAAVWWWKISQPCMRQSHGGRSGYAGLCLTEIGTPHSRIRHFQIGPTRRRHIYLDRFSFMCSRTDGARGVLAVFWYVMYRSPSHVIAT
ncbi:uncharacterized [Tachysurus ichikawai]